MMFKVEVDRKITKYRPAFGWSGLDIRCLRHKRKNA